MKKVLLFFAVLLSLNSSSCFANCIATGGIESVDELNIFPNPTNDKFIVDLPNKSNTAEVFFGLGKLYFLQDTDHLNQLTLDFSEFSKDIYFVKVQHNSMIIKQQKN
jgi:hypothetical protein